VPGDRCCLSRDRRQADGKHGPKYSAFFAACECANVDFGVVKNTTILESHTLQFRAEFYDASNTRNFGVPDATLSSANFLNQWGTDGGNRRILLTLRYAF
jgi:hypothetical protein